MLLDRLGSGCSGSSVVAEARGITVGLPKPSTHSPGEVPNGGFRLHALTGALAATPALLPATGSCPPLYRRPRNPRATALYQLLEAHYETLKGLWEERFERRYGFWRGLYDAELNH